MEAMTTDAYNNLGWEVTSTTMADMNLNYVNISLKRDRKVKDKQELIKLQSKIDKALYDIEKLQKQMKMAGRCESLSVGVVGALTFGGGMSMTMLLSGTAFLVGGIALGCIGVGISLLAYKVYKKIQDKKLVVLEPKHQTELDKLSSLCEEANALIA